MTDSYAIIGTIVAGDADEHLDAIITAAETRKEAAAKEIVWKPGDKATLTGISPKYLNGAPVTISQQAYRSRGERINVDIDPDYLEADIRVRRRFGGGKNIGIFPTCLKPVVD